MTIAADVEASGHASSPVALASRAAEAPPPWRVAPEPFEYTTTRVLAAARKALHTQLGVVRSERSELAERFKMLRNQVLQRMNAEGQRVLAITSAQPIEGKSLVALNLALAIAADFDSTALLVDADFSGDGLQRLFGLPSAPGLSDHLISGAAVSSLLVNPAIDRFVFLPAGSRPVTESAELLGSKVTRDLVAEMRGRYADRIIVVDLPPALSAADALAFLPLADTTLVVVEEHTTRIEDVEALADLLAPFDIVGTVMSRASAQ